MELSALTRTVVKRNHALISTDGYVNSTVPGWTNCTVNVIINKDMGAKLVQTLITLNNNGGMIGNTKTTEMFIYVVSGNCKINVRGSEKSLLSGHYIYIPTETAYGVTKPEAGTRLLVFQKEYVPLEGYPVPHILTADSAKVNQAEYLGDPALRMQVLLPDNLSFDMAVNIFTYDPGGHLPFVETHIMEHGLLYLQGQGIYRLDDQWYPVQKGDSIWMAPYCPQWFTAMGKEPAVYIYYKNVNRIPE
jgi:(S)-ureidoglycine aminohydrolase